MEIRVSTVFIKLDLAFYKYFICQLFTVVISRPVIVPFLLWIQFIDVDLRFRQEGNCLMCVEKILKICISKLEALNSVKGCIICILGRLNKIMLFFNINIIIIVIIIIIIIC